MPDPRWWNTSIKYLLKFIKLLSNRDGIQIKNLVGLNLDFKGWALPTVLCYFEGEMEAQQVVGRKMFKADETALARYGDGIV